MTRLPAFGEPEPLRNGEFALGVPRCIVKVRSYPDVSEGVKLSPGRPISRILCASGARRRPSIWGRCLHRPRAADPALKRYEQHLAPVWPCSRRGLPGHAHYWACR